MSFWLKCSPIIAEKSLKVPSVSAQNKQFPLKKNKANLDQNWPKSAMRVMRILPTRVHRQSLNSMQNTSGACRAKKDAPVTRSLVEVMGDILR